MGESERSRLSVHAPGNEPFARCFNLLDRFGSSELELDPSNNFGFSIIAGDSEASRNDVVEVNHRSDDNVRPFGVGELRGIRRGEDRGLGEFEISRIFSKEFEGSLEIIT